MSKNRVKIQDTKWELVERKAPTGNPATGGAETEEDVDTVEAAQEEAARLKREIRARRAAKARQAGQGDYLEGLANMLEARFAEKLAEAQAPIVDAVNWVESCTEALINRKRRMTSYQMMLGMMWVLVILTAWLRVGYPLVLGLGSVAIAAADTTGSVIADATGDPFQGSKVEIQGLKFNSPENGVLEVTDIMRFRGAHPVTGVPQMHNGIDIGGSFKIYMPFDGTVKRRSPSETGGGGLTLLIIPTSGSHMVQVLHMKSIDVADGEVKRGTFLGVTGADSGTPEAGTSTGPHAHFEVARIKDGDWQGERVYEVPTINLIERFLKIKTPGAVAKPLPGDAPAVPTPEIPAEPSPTHVELGSEVTPVSP